LLIKASKELTMVIFSRNEGGDMYEVFATVYLKIPFFCDTKLHHAVSDIDFSTEGSDFAFNINVF
jgi:hypothetical protein